MTVILLSPLSIRSDHGNFINSCAICLAIRMCLLAFPGTLAPVHLLWRVLRLESTADAHTSTGVSWLLQDGTSHISTSLTNYEF